MVALIDLFYHININPLYLIIPELHGSIEEQKGYNI